MIEHIRRSEKSEEHLCDQFMKTCGFIVVRFSQARASGQTLGISDRRYVKPEGIAVWWEVKSTAGQLTREQYNFLRTEHSVGGVIGCGTLDDLILLHRAKFARDVGMSLVQRWAAKGFRGESKPKRSPETVSP